MGSYRGPAVAIANSAEIQLTVDLHTTGGPGQLRSWGGTVQTVEPTIPNLDMAKLRLPDGREADAIFNVSVSFNAGRTRTRIEVTGSGEPPFDA